MASTMTTARPGLEPLDPLPGWTGNILPVLYTGPRTCRRCHLDTIYRLPPVHQDALFYHGGHGATSRTTVDLCLNCGGTTIASLESIRPPRR